LKVIMTSLSIMFETFVWVLGDEPYLRLHPNQPDKLIKMDVVGRMCMQADHLVSPPRKKMKVKLISPDVVYDFEIRSSVSLKVEDFVKTVNSQAAAVMDVMGQDILVSRVDIEKDTIVLLAEFQEIQTN
jgi:hypothetical protein